MERIIKTFQRTRQEDSAALIPFSVAGFPDPVRSLDVFKTLCEGDLLEFGYPFSDPVADGPIIQKAATEALSNGINMDSALDMLAEVRSKTDIPIVFFSYFNPIHRYGTERFVSRLKESGADGVLIVDLPMEESEWLKPAVDKAGLAWIFLVTPTTGKARIKKMDEEGSGFLYYVSVTGVTGSRSSLPDDLVNKCREVRESTRLPLAVGFGISTEEQTAWLKPHVDGIVVGSAIIAGLQNGNSTHDLKNYVRNLKKACGAQ